MKSMPFQTIFNCAVSGSHAMQTGASSALFLLG
jgi:hypothetical protein